MLSSVHTKGVIGGGSDCGGGIGTNELSESLSWLIHLLRLCTKYLQTTGLLNCLVFYLMREFQSPSIPHEFSFIEYYFL